MVDTTRFQKKYALPFALSVVAFFAVIAIAPQWCWVPIPFLCTYFVQMFDWL